jgi:protein farnesyltransferase/geranylgeranyltransferase type-1 subunit alpha
MASFLSLGDFSDVTPIPDASDADAPARINHTAEFSATAGYLRAALASGDTSPRVLPLTESAVQQNMANYSAWALRRSALLASRADLAAELRWQQGVVRAKDAWKNYQVWQHRRVLSVALGGADAGAAERAFVDEAFADDAKNYHAWSHRQWAANALPLAGGGVDSWVGEAAFARECLERDVLNNSAWNHLWFALSRGGGAPRAVVSDGRAPSVLEAADAVTFAVSALARAPANESAWSFIRALAQVGSDAAPNHDTAALSSGRAWAACPAALEAAERFAATTAFAAEVLAEAAEARGDAQAARGHYDSAARIDPVRAAFWAAKRDALNASAINAGAGSNV